jgi:hypothetical protein
MTIKNGDLPAMPVATEQLYESRCNSGSWELASLGITKREMFAMAAMQGICSSSPTISNELIASEAVALADALLAELERTK